MKSGSALFSLKNTDDARKSHMKLSQALYSTKGQSIVEIALITPLLLVALYIPADFGIAFLTGHLAQNAVREGARIGSISKECGTAPCVSTVAGEACPGINSIVVEVCRRLPARLTSPAVTSSLTGNLGDPCMRTVTVVVEGTYTYFLYQLTALLGLPITSETTSITRSAEARYELQPVTYSKSC
jgi:Flp pilus assembly protein TadG